MLAILGKRVFAAPLFTPVDLTILESKCFLFIVLEIKSEHIDTNNCYFKKSANRNSIQLCTHLARMNMPLELEWALGSTLQIVYSTYACTLVCHLLLVVETGPSGGCDPGTLTH